MPSAAHAAYLQLRLLTGSRAIKVKETDEVLDSFLGEHNAAVRNPFESSYSMRTLLIAVPPFGLTNQAPKHASRRD